jgi:hypothetical protein
VFESKKENKAMTTISLNNPVVTTINTFTVAPEDQQRALELLVALSAQLKETIPGIVSANFHKSADGTRVVNYAQYTSEGAVQAVTAKIFEMAETPLVAEIRKIATPDSRTYELCTIIEG